VTDRRGVEQNVQRRGRLLEAPGHFRHNLIRLAVVDPSGDCFDQTAECILGIELAP
jgi:hypothetical protein